MHRYSQHELLRNVTGKSSVMLSQSVHECICFNGLELALSEKQIPRFVGIVSSSKYWRELLESSVVRPRQARTRLRYAPTVDTV
jgi:hypothetical protein